MSGSHRGTHARRAPGRRRRDERHGGGHGVPGATTVRTGPTRRWATLPSSRSTRAHAPRRARAPRASRRRGPPAPRRAAPLRVVDDAQVQVVGDLLQVGRQGRRQRRRPAPRRPRPRGGGPSAPAPASRAARVAPATTWRRTARRPSAQDLPIAGEWAAQGRMSVMTRAGRTLTERQLPLTLDGWPLTESSTSTTPCSCAPWRTRPVCGCSSPWRRGATISQLSPGWDEQGQRRAPPRRPRAGGPGAPRPHPHRRGGTEQYFERVARRLRTPGGTASGHTAALLAAVADEVDAAPGDPLLHLRRLRMPPARATELAEHLDRLVASLPEDAVSDPVYSVLVAAYRSAGPR